MTSFAYVKASGLRHQVWRGAATHDSRLSTAGMALASGGATAKRAAKAFLKPET
jgi:hypothetical protein